MVATKLYRRREIWYWASTIEVWETLLLPPNSKPYLLLVENRIILIILIVLVTCFLPSNRHISKKYPRIGRIQVDSILLNPLEFT
jgi:hypothetical protein